MKKLKSVIFSNDVRHESFLKSVLESGIKPIALITKTPFNHSRLFFHTITRGVFISSHNKLKFPSCSTALQKGVKVIDFERTSQNKLSQFLKLNSIEYGFVFLFPIIKKEVLSSISGSMINFHLGYLPFNRGASPSNWVIRNGEKETGYSIHLVDKGIDSGEILDQQKITLTGLETTKILNSHLMNLGTRAFIKLILKLQLGDRLKTKPNNLTEGSYQKPFRKELNYFSEENTKTEICAIINSSAGGDYSALFKKGSIDIPIVHVIELQDDYKPNLNKQLVINSSDGHKLLLIPKTKL